MKLPSLLQRSVILHVLRALFSRPYTTKFPKGSYQPVSTFRGRPRFYAGGCIACGACAEVCPPKCIDMIDNVGGTPPTRTLIQHLDVCIWCGQCERYCTTEEGIKLTTEYDCVGFSPEDFEERVEKELLLCECCGSVIAPRDQILWLIRRLGPLAYANPTLMLVKGRDLEIVDDHATGESPGVQRADRMTIQCPKCRRKTSFAV